MAMTDYDTDLTRCLKWMHNDAPNLQSIINQKASWYERYQTQFWTNYQTNIYDIRSCNAFGLVIWCIILGVPLDLFNFEPITNAWAYGSQRGNYLDGGGHTLPMNFAAGPVFYVAGVVTSGTFNAATGEVTFGSAPANGASLSWSGTITQNETGQNLVVTTPRVFGTGNGLTASFNLIPSDAANYNEVGNNFYGGGSQSVSLLTEIRQACQLRYVALVSNGRQQWINQMLQYIFNDGEAWNFPGKVYFYLTDATQATQAIVSANVYAAGVLVPAANYTLNTTTGAITFTTAPANGAALTWDGTWNWASSSTPQAFGTGNGTTTAFTLTQLPGAVKPVSGPVSNYMEYRIGANLSISASFLNIMNDSAYGIMPQCAGIQYKVVQES